MRMTQSPEPMKNFLWRLSRREGQATLEFAVVLPLLLILVLAMLDFGRVFNYWIDETHLANEAVRAAVVNQLPDGTTANPSCVTQTIECQIKQQASTNELKNGSSAISQPVAISFCLPDGSGSIGHPLKAQAQATYNWLGFLTNSKVVPGLSKQITVTATMRLEQKYDAATSKYTVVGC